MGIQSQRSVCGASLLEYTFQLLLITSVVLSSSGLIAQLSFDSLSDEALIFALEGGTESSMNGDSTGEETSLDPLEAMDEENMNSLPLEGEEGEEDQEEDDVGFTY